MITSVVALKMRGGITDHMIKCADTGNSLPRLFAILLILVKNLLVEDRNKSKSF